MMKQSVCFLLTKGDDVEQIELNRTRLAFFQKKVLYHPYGENLAEPSIAPYTMSRRFVAASLTVELINGVNTSCSKAMILLTA